ncbi:zinc-dependent metalloprotease [uncultured Bacteroides sp.]|uniref:zinc-dependent metalloprotease n=1 Tax=uncultured Bacteroides sp. TaxID=162156 RepID=UPI002AA8853A|nr:zinc-dependent metalloprotease [uncultured Bacteroides sp.]
MSKSQGNDTLKTDSLKIDTLGKVNAVKPTEVNPNKPKPYKEVITDKAVTSHGMVDVHRIDDRFFLEIPDTLLGREILVVNRIAKAPAGLRPQVQVFAGDQIGENVIRFEKGPSSRIFIRQMSFVDTSRDSTENGMYRSVIQSNLQPITAAFPVKAYGGDSTRVGTSVIDITDYLQTENELFYFSPEAKKSYSVGAIQSDKSYIDAIHSYPINIEIRTVRSYLKNSSGQNNVGSTMPVTYELNSSLVLLPRVPMKPRYADARVGYFSRGFYDFDADPQGVEEKYYITRWRLEPKPEDRAKYLKGELVEPAKPIIFYIDPATPKKWVPYLIAGVNDWQKAFEQAGFKNAIKAMPAPENDSTWTIEDARHNVIVYKASAIANASGPHVHDPRSGEIIETHVNWYHNVMQLLRSWYMIQAGAIDPRAHKMQFDDELMGQLIRFVSSHEVGHTLGLRHNYGSSSTVPVEKLRDKNWVEKNGHTPSIMDYARFNYVAQPEDKITEKGIFPRIGDYDKWAIEWGYKWLPQFKTADEEEEYSNKLIIKRLNNNKRLFFGSEYESTDPRSQSEDLGDDPVLASTYGMKNLKRILPQLRDWTCQANKGYDGWRNIYVELLKQYKLYNAHVLKLIDGSYVTPKSVEQSGAVFVPVEYEKQKAAVRFLTENVFNTPKWLINDSITAYTGASALSYISAAQQMVLFRIEGSAVLSDFIKNESEKKNNSYGITEFLNDMKQSIWTELYTHKPIDIYRRKLQKIYIDNAFKSFKATNTIVGRNDGNGTIIYMDPDPTLSDVSSVIRSHLLSLSKDMTKEINRTDDELTKYHLLDLINRIDQELNKKNSL